MTSIVLLGGFHGVGKTYCAERLGAASGWKHLRASDLISVRRGRESWSRERVVAEADLNQLALMEEVRERARSVRRILLDGHFTLRSPNGPYFVPIDVFAQLGLCGAIVIEEAPQVVHDRLKSRGTSFSLGEITMGLERERCHAERVSRALLIPFRRIQRASPEKLLNALNELSEQT